MSLYCDDGALADITPWVPMPPSKPKEQVPREPDRDRCRRASCRKVASEHHSDPPVILDALDRAIYAAAFVSALGRNMLPSESCGYADIVVTVHRSARTR